RRTSSSRRAFPFASSICCSRTSTCPRARCSCSSPRSPATSAFARSTRTPSPSATASSATATRCCSRASPGCRRDERARAGRPRRRRDNPLMLTFQVLATEGLARRGRLTLRRGVVETPVFMPVGTYGSVKGVLPSSLEAMGAEIILGNTFHLWLRPGTDVIARFGGLHRFEGWTRPILTDSGGFQVWSLGANAKVSEQGVGFQSPVNGDKLLLTPEVSMQIQHVLGSDIVMQFDECTAYEVEGRITGETEARRSMEMSVRWAVRSRAEFARLENPNALFGIVQGGMFES